MIDIVIQSKSDIQNDFKFSLQIKRAETKEEYLSVACRIGDELQFSGFNKVLNEETSQLAVYTLKENHIFYRCLGQIRQFMEGMLKCIDIDAFLYLDESEPNIIL